MKMTPEPNLVPKLGPGKNMALWDSDDPELGAVAEVLADWFGLKLLDAIPATEHGLGTILLLCRAPSEYICRALGQGEDTTAALESWQAKVRPVLTLKRRKRDQTHLVDIEALCRDPLTFLRHFGLPEKDGVISVLSALADPAPDPILQILAQQSLHADIVCRALASEFDAVAVNLQADDPQDRAALDVLAQAYRQRQDEQTELNLLRSQQQSMYQQMETLYAEKIQAEQRLVQVNNGLESSQAQIKALQDERQRFRNQIGSRDNDIEGLRNRMAIKEKVLQKTGRMLRDLEQTKVALEQDNAALQHVTETLRGNIASFEQNQKEQAERIGTLEAEMHRILNSRSYRLMAPLRHLRTTLKGKKGD